MEIFLKTVSKTCLFQEKNMSFIQEENEGQYGQSSKLCGDGTLGCVFMVK